MKIIAENLGKRFNREWVFRNFNYQFDSGNKYAIIGPNGSGKSTLMQILWGQMLPTTGTVNFGIESNKVYQHVAIAAPYMDLIEEFTLEEMVSFHFKFKKPTLPLEKIVGAMELESSKKKLLSTFSTGMRQRLKLALAFYSKADFIFLDEPCTNLDKSSIQWYHHHLNRQAKETLIFIASNQEIEYGHDAIKVDILDYK